VQLTTLIVYAELWLVSVDAPVRQEVFGTSPQTNHLKRSDILEFAHQTYSVNSSKKWKDTAGAFGSFRVSETGLYTAVKRVVPKMTAEFGKLFDVIELRININKQDLRPRENIWRLPGLWLSWPNIFPELVQVGKRHQEPYVGLVDLWFPGAPLFSFDRAQAAPFERQPLKMARTSPKAKAGVSPRRIGLQPIDTGNGLRT